MFLPRVFMLPALLLSALAAGAAPPEPNFDHYVIEAMRAWKVPGLAVAIVKDDRIVAEAHSFVW